MLRQILRNKTKLMLLSIAIIIIFTLSLTYIYIEDVYDNLDSYKNKLIRFHVIANSDSKYDQDLKLKVRDKVLEEVGYRIDSSKSIEETRQILKNSLSDIEYIAENEILNNGKDYDVSVYLGDYDFPTKSYGNFTLPAGEYEAVRVVIGEGVGQNWWCVMFPPLCYVDISHGLTNQKSEEELRKYLNEKEYNMIRSAKDEEESVVLKFKIVELLQKTKFAKLFVGSK